MNKLHAVGFILGISGMLILPPFLGGVAVIVSAYLLGMADQIWAYERKGSSND